MLKDLAFNINQTAREHGWWEGERSFPELIALCHSELSEALESWRDNEPPLLFRDENGVAPVSVEQVRVDVYYKPDGWGIELADCMIRILDMFEHYGEDPDFFIALKMNYNKTRPYRHGGKRA